MRGSHNSMIIAEEHDRDLPTRRFISPAPCAAPPPLRGTGATLVYWEPGAVGGASLVAPGKLDHCDRQAVVAVGDGLPVPGRLERHELASRDPQLVRRTRCVVAAHGASRSAALAARSCSAATGGSGSGALAIFSAVTSPSM